jgi:hypothetical protein
MSELTPKQLATVAAARKRNAAAKKDRDEVPTQRIRTAAQGLTLGFGDEIEAGVRHPFDSERRSDKLSELQGGIKAYQAARPLESMAYELGGAVAPAILSLGGSAPVSAAAVGARVLPRLMQGSGIVPRLLRGTAAGAGGGAAYAIGTGEGSMGDRIKRAPAGALGGGAGGFGGTAVLGGVSALTTKLVDIARERLGVSGTRAVTAELQRLATESGKSVDQIVQDLQSGSIMAENATLADAVRALARTSGGKAQADMQTGIKTRSSETFADAKTEIQRYLADSTDDNVRRQVRRSDDAARKAENEAYAIFETGTIGQEVQDQVSKAIRAVPSSADDIQTALLARGAEPLFNMVDGSPVFTRSPTPLEAEIVRRSIDDSTKAAFKRSAGTVGTAFGDVERGLRNSIDEGVEGMSGVRADAAALRTSRDSFLAGQKSITSGADQVEIDFAGLPTDEAIASYRAGFMDILRRKFQGQQPASIMAQLRNETAEGVAGEKNLGLIFRTVFPESPMEDVVRRIGIASKGQDMKALLGGSGTAPTASAAKRAGSSFNAEEFIGAATGSTMDLGRLLRRFINRDGVDLTDAQNQEVVRVLLSENPDFVRRAMTDQTGWGALDRAVAQTLERLAIGGTRAATVGGAGVSVGLLGPQ